ncbi:hypothetical protein NMG60_11033278 [Bertholletia excelsa]
MANSTAPPAAQRPAHSRLVRIIAIVLLTLIVLVAVAVLVIWLAIRPKRLVYTVEHGSIQGFNLTGDNHLNATFNFALRSYNPNTRVSIYYDKIEAWVSYNDLDLAFTSVDPFYQPRRNVTHLELKLVAQQSAMYGAVAKDLRMEKAAGEVEVDVRLKARVRLKAGAWKSNHRTLKVECSPVRVPFSSSKGFERTYCDAEL